MKTIILFLFLIPTVIVLNAQDTKEKRIKSDIKSVMVYLDGSEITRTESVDLLTGKTKLVFEGLSPEINPKSIRVKTDKEVNILSITSKIDYLYKEELSPRIKQLKDSSVLIQNNITKLNDEKGAYSAEKQMILQNQSIRGDEKGVTTVELTQTADFFRSRIKEINLKISELSHKNMTESKILNRIENQLISLNHKCSYLRSEITILLEAKAKITTDVEVKYLVKEAGWVPIYDIKAEDINQPITLIYRAKVFNNTEIDWNNVSIKLSTADPTMNASKPDLTAWHLNYDYGGDYQYSLGNVYDKNYAVAQEEQLYEQKAMEKEKRSEGRKGDFAKTLNIPTQPMMIQVSELSAEFEIKEKYSVLADANPYFMDVETHNLPATYKHFTAPKLDRNAFLLARITGWEDLNLISGFASIYFNDAFVGKSFINTGEVSDTLDISLGRDNKILVNRTKQKDFSSKKLIGSNRKEVQAFEIVVKNNRKAPINIEIIDQIPVSQDSDIEVSQLEISNAEINELSGELKWEFNILPAESKKVNLSFSIKYPKSKPIQTKKQAYRSMRFF